MVSIMYTRINPLPNITGIDTGCYLDLRSTSHANMQVEAVYVPTEAVEQ